MEVLSGETRRRLAHLHLKDVDVHVADHHNLSPPGTYASSGEYPSELSREDSHSGDNTRNSGRPMAARTSRHADRRQQDQDVAAEYECPSEATDVKSEGKQKIRRKKRKRRHGGGAGPCGSCTSTPGYSKLLQRRPPRLSSAPAKMTRDGESPERRETPLIQTRERPDRISTPASGASPTASSNSKVNVSNAAFSQWARNQMLLKYSGINRAGSQPVDSSKTYVSANTREDVSAPRPVSRDKAVSTTVEKDNQLWNKSSGNTSWVPQGQFPTTSQNNQKVQTRRLGELRFRTDQWAHKSNSCSEEDQGGKVYQSKTFMFNPSLNIMNALRVSNISRSCVYSSPNRSNSSQFSQCLQNYSQDEERITPPIICFNSDDRLDVRPILKSADSLRRSTSLQSKSVRFQMPENRRDLAQQIDV